MAYAQNVEYLLFAGSKRDYDEENKILVWQIDDEGRPLTKTAPPLDVEALTDKAMSAISPDLASHEGFTGEEIMPIRARIVEALNIANTKNRGTLNGSFPEFGYNFSSHDGKKLLYISNGETTQLGMRPPDELPQVVIADVADRSEICRLKGHTDAIMWSGWSADDKTVVTAPWDETFKIWDANTGECRHTIGPTGGQNWAGQLSPSGQHVVLSGGAPVSVALYDLQNGDKLAELDIERLKRKGWHRELSWSPAGDHVAIVSGLHVLLCSPFSDTLETIVELESDGSIMDVFTTFDKVKWVDGGSKLILQGSEKTIFVWDRKQNCKWRFQHPKSVAVEYLKQLVYYMAEESMIVSVDGDRKVRYWKL